MRIALSTLGTRGDVVPFVEMARALAARGHAVTVQSPAGYAPAFAAVDGVRFVAAAGRFDAERLEEAMSAAERDPHPLAQVERFARYFYFDHGEESLRGSLAALDGHDLVVCNVVDALAAEAAELLRLPWVSWASKPPSSGAAAAAEDRVLAPVDDQLSRFIAALGGVRARVPIFRAPSPLANLCGASPALAEWPAGGVPGWHLTGACLPAIGDGTAPLALGGARAAAAPLPDDVARFLDEGPPPLLVTFGSRPGIDRRTAICLAALARSGRRAIVQGTPPAAGGSATAIAPAPAVLFTGRLHYPTVLARVAGVVHHGGSGTVAEVARAGVPSFAVPCFADQYYWGPRIARLGLGPPCLPHHQLTVDALAERMAALDAPACRERAAAIALAMRGEDGAAASARLLEELFTRGRPGCRGHADRPRP